MTLSDISAQIEAAEQRERYYEAAEHRNYMAEGAARAANYSRLHLLRLRLANAIYRETAAEQVSPDRG
jgi:hypothetical protein